MVGGDVVLHLRVFVLAIVVGEAMTTGPIPTFILTATAMAATGATTANNLQDERIRLELLPHFLHYCPSKSSSSRIT